MNCRFIETVLSLSVIVVVITAASQLVPVNKRRKTEVHQERNCTKDSTCPTWFICDFHDNCQCGREHDGIISCRNKTMTSAVLDCHCVTYDKDTRYTFVGACFYNCENHHSKEMNDLVYRDLPKEPEMLINNSVCTYFHRTGLLCGDCEDGHSPLVLSYNLSCVKCPDGHKNWWKFILVAFAPLTCFYFFIVLFNINVTSSRLHGAVWFSQALSTPVLVRLIFSAMAQENQKLLKAAKILTVFYSFWNLEFFRSVIPDICLNVTTLQALALEYMVAAYPFLLILISYLAIELYDKEVVCIVLLWKPFRRIIRFFHKSWDIRTSVIDSFATFFSLSYIKVLSVTTDLLVPTQIYQLGSNISTFGLYYSPSVAYFGREHLPYAVLALIMFAIFVAIPTVTVLLYPFQCFQKLLSIFPVNWHFLHAFIDSFQGCYKDGTERGTFDCRWFSAIILLSRTLFFLTFGLTVSVMSFIYSLLVLIALLIAFINVQPFKKDVVRYPLTDSIFLILFTLFYIAVVGRNSNDIHNSVYHMIITLLMVVLGIAPLIYITCLIGSWLISRVKWINALIKSTHKK